MRCAKQGFHDTCSDPVHARACEHHTAIRDYARMVILMWRERCG